MPTQEISEPQRRTLSAISSLTKSYGYPPTLQELAGNLGISVPSAHAQVNQLARKGFIRREPRRARSIEVIAGPKDDPDQYISVPVVGRVAAGKPILAEENVIGEVMALSRLVGRSVCFALEVTGDSMTGAGIQDGDLCIVRQQPGAESGEIVVALVGEEATVKRLRLWDEGVQLLPENPKYEPMTIAHDEDFRVIGKVIATVHRKRGGL